MLDEERAARLDNFAREPDVARLCHGRPGNVVAMADHGSEMGRDRECSSWALVVSNLGPPPCKGEEDESPTSGDPENPSSDPENG